MKTVLFACVHNAGRSQMAAAIFNQLADATKARGISAGKQPGARVHPEVVEVMREKGVDLEGIAPVRLTDSLAAKADILVTMGCGEACPVVPGVERDDWPLDDPKGQPIERVRYIRDQVELRVRELLTEVGFGRQVRRDNPRGCRSRQLRSGDAASDAPRDMSRPVTRATESNPAPIELSGYPQIASGPASACGPRSNRPRCDDQSA
jgi:arsenate reductase